MRFSEGEMAFSSLIFLLLFLPVWLIVYRIVDGTDRKNRVLLIASLIFYVFGGIRYLILLVIMAAAGWFFGLRIAKAGVPEVKKRWLTVSVAAFIAVLVVFKYTGFFTGIAAALFHSRIIEIALPVGISFYTFKLISYVADVYNGVTPPEERFWIFLLYLVNFHQITQGPIARYSEMRGEIAERRMTRGTFSTGIYRFSVGLAKKAILADHCGEIAGALVPTSSEIAKEPTLALWLGMAVYTMQLYLDFSAYTDMAIGLGHMIGFHYPENFNYPYTARSVREFWRRWHMTLSFFFRDYVYIPLGGSRKGSARTILNLLVVWALTGFWHGASWNFILWGLYYFVFVVFENWRRHSGRKEWHPALQHVYLLAVVLIGWIFFRFSDFRQLGWALRGFFGFGGNGFATATVRLTFLNNLWFLIFCALSCTPVFRDLGKRIREFFRGRKYPQGVIYGAKTVLVIVLLVLSIFVLASSTYQPFLYKNF